MKAGIRAAPLNMVLGIGLCLLSSYAPAQDCPVLVGEWTLDPAYALAASGDLVVFGNGASLLVADVTDPGSPQVVGGVVLPGKVMDIWFFRLKGTGRLFVNRSRSRLRRCEPMTSDGLLRRDSRPAARPCG